MSHLVLLGDSILDNGAYVPGRPAVVDQVRNRLPDPWKTTLGARDGSVIADVHRQLERLPGDASHLVLSAGGNDVLFEIGILGERVATVGEGLRHLAALRDRFFADYLGLMLAIRGRGLRAAVCTIYEPHAFDERLHREVLTALCLFNDGIIRAAARSRFPVLDLRAICSEVGDFANEIEPSSAGGAKIAEAIVNAVIDPDFGTERTVLLP